MLNPRIWLKDGLLLSAVQCDCWCDLNNPIRMGGCSIGSGPLDFFPLIERVWAT